MRLDFFDCNAQIGRFGAPEKEHYFEPEELTSRLGECGIQRALVFHALAKELHPAEGNRALSEAIRGKPELVACWVAMPHHTGEMPPPSEFVREMKLAGACAVRLFPAYHNYQLADWCIGEMLDEFEARGVPVFIEAGQTNYDQLAGVLRSHPKLRLVVMQTSYRCDRQIYPLFEKYEHFKVETSSYLAAGGIEAICKRFGAERLVFGTGAPYTEPGAAVASITFADISDEAKQAIASGNLERLLMWE
ncbi:MAG: amidohydrolase family protein [Armatimonadota bacterium]|nr:amidohydrolase family protein [Armatimonadota bacterium]